MSANWEESNEYKAILEILESYWTMEPNELKVRVTMDFVKANGETQQKCIVWTNPNYEYTGKARRFVSIAEIDESYLQQKEAEFWASANLYRKRTHSENEDPERLVYFQ